jgi:hypothetical protein
MHTKCDDSGNFISKFKKRVAIPIDSEFGREISAFKKKIEVINP